MNRDQSDVCFHRFALHCMTCPNCEAFTNSGPVEGIDLCLRGRVLLHYARVAAESELYLASQIRRQAKALGVNADAEPTSEDNAAATSAMKNALAAAQLFGTLEPRDTDAIDTEIHSDAKAARLAENFQMGCKSAPGPTEGPSRLDRPDSGNGKAQHDRRNGDADRLAS